MGGDLHRDFVQGTHDLESVLGFPKQISIFDGDGYLISQDLEGGNIIFLESV